MFLCFYEWSNRAGKTDSGERGKFGVISWSGEGKESDAQAEGVGLAKKHLSNVMGWKAEGTGRAVKFIYKGFSY